MRWSSASSLLCRAAYLCGTLVEVWASNRSGMLVDVYVARVSLASSKRRGALAEMLFYVYDHRAGWLVRSHFPADFVVRDSAHLALLAAGLGGSLLRSACVPRGGGRFLRGRNEKRTSQTDP